MVVDVVAMSLRSEAQQCKALRESPIDLLPIAIAGDVPTSVDAEFIDEMRDSGETLRYAERGSRMCAHGFSRSRTCAHSFERSGEGVWSRKASVWHGITLANVDKP
jgi:hypothetical protein